MRELAETILSRAGLRDARRLLISPRRTLATLYASSICNRLSDCSSATGTIAGLYIEALIEGERLDTSGLPSHIRVHIERALSEVEDAALRAPTSLYAQIGLDADLLSRMGAVSLLSRGSATRLRDFFALFAEALSYAYASDYIVYTKPAKSLIQVLKPHTIAMAKWAIEELASLGISASIKAERTAGGLVAYIDIHECLGSRVSKLASIKPTSNCILYRLNYECTLGTIEYELCIPESTRTR